MASLSRDVFAKINLAMDRDVEGGRTPVGLTSIFNVGPNLSGVAENLRYDDGSVNPSRTLNI